MRLSDDDHLYLGHMLDMAKKARLLITGKTLEDYYLDDALHFALAHLIQTIGEAATRISSDTCNAHPKIPWREITGMRHKIVHDYMDVDEDLVWSVVVQDLPELIDQLEKMSLDD